MQDYVIHFFETVLTNIHDIRNNKDESIIKKVIHLVDQKYNTTDISLKTLSGEVFLSPNYLGNIFKKSISFLFS
jgi:two-component system response regulator YesN